MSRYAWYSPEIDIIVFQTILDGCVIGYEWDRSDMMSAKSYLNNDEEPMRQLLWCPLGEI